MLLPEIQLPGKPPASENGKGGDNRRGSTEAQTAGSISSKNLNQNVVKSSYEHGNKSRDALNRVLNRNLIDIREESFDSDKSCSSLNLSGHVLDHSEKGAGDGSENASNPAERVDVSVGGAPFPNRKLLSHREHCAPATIRRASSSSAPLNTHLSTVRVTTSSLAPVETDHSPHNLYKSKSQHSLSSTNRENLVLPSITKKSASQREISRESYGRITPTRSPNSGGSPESDYGGNGTKAAAGLSLRHVTSTPDFGESSSAGRKPPTMLSQRNKSTSVFSVIPCKLPSILTRSKSISQTDISKQVPADPSSFASSASSMPVEPFSCNPVLARKQRIHSLWTAAGEKLGLRRKNPDDAGGGTIATWATGPGNLIRPNYARWCERRYALAEPERMCMPQEVRERIQMDVHIRKRSLKRRMSNFLTVKLGLNKEEDLVS